MTQTSPRTLKCKIYSYGSFRVLFQWTSVLRLSLRLNPSPFTTPREIMSRFTDTLLTT